MSPGSFVRIAEATRLEAYAASEPQPSATPIYVACQPHCAAARRQPAIECPAPVARQSRLKMAAMSFAEPQRPSDVEATAPALASVAAA